MPTPVLLQLGAWLERGSCPQTPDPGPQPKPHPAPKQGDCSSHPEGRSGGVSEYRVHKCVVLFPRAVLSFARRKCPHARSRGDWEKLDSSPLGSLLSSAKTASFFPVWLLLLCGASTHNAHGCVPPTRRGEGDASGCSSFQTPAAAPNTVTRPLSLLPDGAFRRR